MRGKCERCNLWRRFSFAAGLCKRAHAAVPGVVAWPVTQRSDGCGGFVFDADKAPIAKRRARAYSPAELATIEREYATRGPHELSRQFGTSWQSVAAHAAKFGLTQSGAHKCDA